MAFTKGAKKFGGKQRSPKFGERSGFVKRDAGRPSGFSKGKFELFDATCSNCGKACQLPFRPNGSKPVLCRDCFGKGDAPMRRPDNRSAPRSDELAEINEKLDRIMRALKID
jgi:CxxC-x17-CxxC domain-containing protein